MNIKFAICLLYRIICSFISTAIIIVTFFSPYALHASDSTSTCDTIEAVSDSISTVDTIGAVIDSISTVDTIGAVSDSSLQEEPVIEVILEDGQILIGYLVMETDSTMELRLKSGSRIWFQKSGIDRIRELKHTGFDSRGRVRFEDPNRTRYLFAPSAMMLRKGEMKFSQKELLWSSFSIGATEFLSFEIGGAVPMWFIEEGDGINLLIAVKAGGHVGGPVHLAGGILTFSLPTSPLVLGLPFGSVTIGNIDYHGTFSASVPFQVTDDDFEIGDFYWFALCGNARLSAHVALVSENWIFSFTNGWSDDTELILNLAVRFIGKRFAADVGLFFNNEFYMPLPWLGFTFHLKESK